MGRAGWGGNGEIRLDSGFLLDFFGRIHYNSVMLGVLGSRGGDCRVAPYGRLFGLLAMTRHTKPSVTDLVVCRAINRTYGKRMRTIAMINQKGGCGKTTTAINTAAAFAALGYRTLLVDLDPQGHACMGLGIDPDKLTPTVYDALTDPKLPLIDAVINTKVEWLDLAPCNVLLAGAELELAGAVGKELILASKLRMLRERYKVCIIDSPPALGILTLNALVASTDVVVPVQVHYFALEGLKRLLETVHIIRNRFHPCSSEVLGLLLTFVEDGTIFSRQVQEKMRAYFGQLVFETVIHKTIRLAEAPSAGEPILTYAPESRGAADYMSLVREILTDPVWAEEVGNVQV